jgi:hypothetical protein
MPMDRDSPVFILTASRSGSTLLRFILDSHPDLARPPETLIGSSCAAMLHLFDSLEHSRSADKNPGRCIMVRYEDMVTAPEDVMARILAFIGASPSPGMLRRIS